MKLIYLAGKYSGNSYAEVENNIQYAESVMIKLLLAGWNVFSPHKNTSHLDRFKDSIKEFTYDFFMKRCFDMIDRCDAICFLENWESSPGSKEELEYAKKKNMTIFFIKEGIPTIN
jgi:hypothetical protein